MLLLNVTTYILISGVVVIDKMSVQHIVFERRMQGSVDEEIGERHCVVVKAGQENGSTRTSVVSCSLDRYWTSQNRLKTRSKTEKLLEIRRVISLGALRFYQKGGRQLLVETRHPAKPPIENQSTMPPSIPLSALHLPVRKGPGLVIGSVMTRPAGG